MAQRDNQLAIGMDGSGGRGRRTTPVWAAFSGSKTDRSLLKYPDVAHQNRRRPLIKGNVILAPLRHYTITPNPLIITCMPLRSAAAAVVKRN